MFISNF
jgi:hypothetical protein